MGRNGFTLARGIAATVLLCLPLGARAQDIPPEVQVAPTTEEVQPEEGPSSLDLQNLVTTAAKGITTVQEAPAIVTIITADDLQTWGHRWLEDVIADVPGWGHYPAEGETIPTLTVRGQTQSMLFLHDGVSLFNAARNVNGIRQTIPLESIKRIEVVTGPGGVLWGANSFQGILNIVTKDADDVSGVEGAAGYGDGRGMASDFRAYLMTGQSLLDGRVKLFLHGSYENYEGQIIQARQYILGPPAPQPNGTLSYGNLQESDAPRSFVYVLDGKVSSGPFTLHFLWNDGKERSPGLFTLGILQQNAAANLPWGGNDANDPRKVGRDSRLSVWDRFAALEYRDRAADGRVGIDMKGYFVQSVVDLTQFMFFPPSSVLLGGASFNVPNPSQRVGFTLDADVALPYSNRLLFGGEVFEEWQDAETSVFNSPDPSLPNFPGLPFSCPHASAGKYVPMCPVAFVFGASRDVAAAFLSDQWRPFPSLILDGGARVQAAFGDRPYDTLGLFSGTAVWNFLPGWHVKANFSQGFRPPVFANTSANGAAVNLGGNPNLKNEFSSAGQGEVNARVLRNVRKIRELTMRADYSYTRIDNLIVVNNGGYQNSGKRGIHSAEFLGRLYLRGDHTIQLGYTFAQIADDQKGLDHYTPNHWFTFNTSFNVVRGRMDAVSTLWLSGSTLDPNRLPTLTNGFCMSGVPASTSTCGADARVSDVALDRLPAIARWNLGLRVRNVIDERLELTAFVYNVLDQHYFYPDAFYDLSPQLETQPFPGMGRAFFANLRYRY